MICSFTSMRRTARRPRSIRRLEGEGTTMKASYVMAVALAFLPLAATSSGAQPSADILTYRGPDRSERISMAPARKGRSRSTLR